MKKGFLLCFVSLFAMLIQAQVTKEVALSESGRLKSLISSSEAKVITKLIVTGASLNTKDLEFISKMPSLETLDVSGSGMALSTVLKKPVANVREIVLSDDYYSRDNQVQGDPIIIEKEKELVALRQMKKRVERFKMPNRQIFTSLERVVMLSAEKIIIPSLNEKAWITNNMYCQSDGSIVWEKNNTNYGEGLIIAVWKSETDPKNCFYIGGGVYSNFNDAKRLVIPKETKFIDTDAFLPTYPRRTSIDEITTEETDEPLYIASTAFGGVNIKKITFNRPVIIDRYAFFISDIAFAQTYCPTTLVFNDDVIYIGKGAFGCVKTVQFSKVPQKLDANFIGSDWYPSNYKQILVPSGTEQQIASLGVMHSRIKTLRDGNNQSKSYSFKQEKPGTILSHVSPNDIEDVDSLTIVGFLYETDLQIISQMKSLSYLDISKTYTTYSPEYLKNRRELQEYQAAMLKALGEVAKLDLLDGSLTPSDYVFTRALTKIAADNIVDKSEPGCILPDDAFKNLMKLETVKLPLRLSVMGKNVLRNCESLKAVGMPQYLERIGTGSFGNCKSLESIQIPSSLKSIGEKGLESDPYGPDPHVCTFDFSGVKTLDFSQCVFEKDDWLACLRECNNLQSVRLPQNIKWVSNLSISPNVDYYFPVTLKAFLQFWGGASNANLHFKSQTPPDLSGNTITNCTIYCPKDCTTAYYSKFGAGNKYIEE